MTAAYRLKGLGLFAGCVVVTLGFYLVSLQVAAERKKLEGVDAKIRVAERDIRALETEFDTRANLAQLERWNGETLALVAPGAGQFVPDEAQLASIRFDAGPISGGAVRTAALVVPAFTPQVAAPTVAPTIASAAPVATRVTVRVAVAAPVRAPITPPVLTVAAVGASPVRKQTVAMLDRSLLSDATLGDLTRGARGEAGRLR